jgi:hypothetical protein
MNPNTYKRLTGFGLFNAGIIAIILSKAETSIIIEAMRLTAICYPLYLIAQTFTDYLDKAIKHSETKK